MSDVETELEIVEELDFSEARACELEGHDYDKSIHDNGPGVWYATLKCPECGGGDVYGRNTIILCNKYKNFALSFAQVQYCVACYGSRPFYEYVVILGKVGDVKEHD